MPDRPIRFLLVDDVAENLIALEALLVREGLEIHKARSGAEALELMLMQDFQLAFVDVQMPGMNGYELAELMRGTERTRSIPIIFVTAAELSEARRFRGYEAGGVDYIFKPIDPVILQSKAEVFFRLGRQAKDLERQRDELRESARTRDLALASLRAHADNSPLALVECDDDLTVNGWSLGAERILGIAPAAMIGQPLAHAGLFPNETLAMLANWIAGADSLARHTAEVVAETAAGRIHAELYGSVLTDPASGRASLSLQLLDVTERHRAEEVRSLLVGELNHRIKNTLANVQAIARQTLRHSRDLDDFGMRFSGRLQALARAHSILSDVTWSSASLDELLDDLIRAGTLDPDSLHRSGPQIGLSPENTLRMALVLHELVTNAAKYGALSVPEGRIQLHSALENGELTLVWREIGGPPVTPPAAPGFGSTLIEAGTGDHEASVDWRAEGAVWTIRIRNGFTCAAPAGSGQPAPPGKGTHPADAITGCRVLLVEDEPLVAMDVTCELEDAGAALVHLAQTVEEAIAAADAGQIDVALLDGNLAGQPVDRVAETLARRNIPFCFVSGYGKEHLPRAFADTPVLTKPVDPGALLDVIGRIRARQTAET